MPVVLLDNASLDKSSTVESEPSSKPSNVDSPSAGSTNDQSISESTHATGSTSSSSSSSSSSTSSKSTDSSTDSRDSNRDCTTTTSASGMSSTNNRTHTTSPANESSSSSSFNIIDNIKKTSNKLKSEFKKRVYNNDGSFSSLKSGAVTFATITESLSASSDEMIDSMAKTFNKFKSPRSPTSSTFETKTYDIEDEEDDEEYAWSAVPLPKSFDHVEISTPSGNVKRKAKETFSKQMSITSKNSSNDESQLLSPSSESSENSSFEEEGSRDVSLLDHSASRDDEADDNEYLSDSDTDSQQSTGSYSDDYSEMDALAALGGVMYQIGSCNFRDIKAGLADDEYSVSSETFTDPKYVKRGRSMTPRSIPSYRSFVEQSKSFLGFGDDADSQINGSASINTPTRKKTSTFFQVMFSCGG